MEKADRGHVAEKYARAGHPSIEELIAEQGTKFPADPADLLGDFWPEERSTLRTSLRRFMSGVATTGLTAPHEARCH